MIFIRRFYSRLSQTKMSQGRDKLLYTSGAMTLWLTMVDLDEESTDAEVIDFKSRLCFIILLKKDMLKCVPFLLWLFTLLFSRGNNSLLSKLVGEKWLKWLNFFPFLFFRQSSIWNTKSNIVKLISFLFEIKIIDCSLPVLFHL